MEITAQHIGIELLRYYPDVQQYRYRVSDERGYCEVSMYVRGNPDRLLSSFGGSLWPADFPQVFRHLGPDQHVTYRSFPAFRPDVELPRAEGLEAVIV